MTELGKERIAFDVETSRILQILSSEIYDSPKAFLRENVQNAYDAILMRCTAQNLSIGERKIEITVENGRLIVCDDGIGMSEDVLKNNFWKAGSSGKKSELAQRSGVIGTFGIGAMANFGVCTALRVETRHIKSDVTLVSSARRDDLRIAQDCIDLERVGDGRRPGTLIVADLDPSYPIDESAACAYLSQYVRFLPVPVSVNGRIISQEAYEDTLIGEMEGFDQISSRDVSRGGFAGKLHVYINTQSRLLVHLTDISLNSNPITGEAFFVQQGNPTLAFRNFFGLAPVPVHGQYGLGGFVNLNILQPTAGREALSRESIQYVANLVELIEAEASVDIANTDAADNNQQFQQYILSHDLIRLAHRVRISVRPAEPETMIALGEVKDYEPEKEKYYYAGRDTTILNQFANEQANLFHVSQSNPRRSLQVNFLDEIARLRQVPDEIRIDRIPATELTLEEAMFLVRLRGVLLDDYLMPDIDAAFATISHGVAFHAESKDGALHISIERNLNTVRMVVECYRTARDVFDGFVKDFVREHLYPHIRNYVPSSTKQGRDALYQRLKANRELFRLQESDYGKIEAILADYLSGKAEFSEVLMSSGNQISSHMQQVSNEQIGSVESEIPDIIESPTPSSPSDGLDARPAIVRSDIVSDMKILTVSSMYPMLNNFQMFLAVSDGLVKREGEFLHWPHTTKLMWGTHRVIYIFTDEAAEVSLYYDIELKTPLETDQTGGSMFPSTTIVTKNKVYIPVPNILEAAFQVVEGTKEFYVRFDTIP